MDPVTPVAEMLQTYGGWGVATLAVAALWRMAAYITALHKEQREETKESIAALVSTRDAMRAFEAAMHQLAAKVERG